ncbi:TonB-dependent receptor [Sphingomonas metalli]|uniref:TonB-dependent receptor n=1 Tax=Sphingomonas metalli TaxID=1779358 RepID=A0A916T376_9SPHN|nr:TonB-dependent receptor [Sphingomonas metalli]GGB29941.1 TonB-dependent receptor [Sphingomonas metalli]
MRNSAPTARNSYRFDRLLIGASATALCIASLAAPAMAQTGDPSPTGAQAGEGTAGSTTPATSASTTPAGTQPVAGTAPGADAETQADPSTGGADEIVVTGIRQSLANAQNIKRNSDTVVDAITASDIGALPDRSVTEALQRVPGVAISRFAGSNDPDHFSVEGSGVNVRGLNFVRSEFNGRDTFSAGIGGQAINFGDVPSELLGSVEVYKNATAELIEGGLAGTVNLNTRKPFDNKGLHVAFSGEANYGDFQKKWSPTGSLLVSDTWDTGIGTFGLLGNVSYSRIRSRADGIQVTNFQTRDNQLALAANSTTTTVCRNPLPGSGDSTTLPVSGGTADTNAACGAANLPGADGFADPADLRYAPIGGQFRTQDFDRKRDGFALAGQWQSTDGKTVLTAQFLRTHSTNLTNEHTFETAPDLSEYSTYPVGCLQNGNGPVSNGNTTTRAECPVGGFTNYTYTDGGLFQSGYITQPGSGYRAACSGQVTCVIPTGGTQQSLSRGQTYDENSVNDFGMNLKTELSERLSLNLDGDYTRARHTNTDLRVFGSTFADSELDISGKLPVVIPHKPTTLAASWATPNPTLVGETDQQYFADRNVQFWRAAMDHVEDSTGREYAFRADLDYKFGEGGFLTHVKFGARYADRSADVRYTTYNWGALSEVWSGTAPVSFAQSAGSTDFYSFPNFFRGATNGPPGAYYYTGDLVRGGYDSSVAYLKQVAGLWAANGATATTWTPAAERAGVVAGTPFLPSEIQQVTQQDKNLYAQLNFATPGSLFGDVRLSGNVGVRYVVTDVTSAGSIGAPTQQQTGTADPYNVRCVTTTTTRPDGTVVTNTPGGACTLGEAGYNALRTFSNGQTNAQIARTNYGYWLPSANLKFGLGRDLILRLAASKVLTRPDLANIRNFLQVGFDPNSGQPTATAGNPYLKPATAWQFDATLEWYFGRVGQLSIDAFYKSVHNFFYQSLINRDVTSAGITQTVQVRGPANYDGYGKIKGFEVAYQQTFDFLPSFFSGLGTSLNYSYIDSKGLPNSFLNGGAPSGTSNIVPGSLPLEGLSKHNANATVFYEKGPVSLRAAYSWRSRYLLTAADVIFPYTSIYQAAGGQLDASALLNVTKNIKIGVQGVNLANQVIKTEQAYISGSTATAPRSYFVNDRRFSFILRGNF